MSSFTRESPAELERMQLDYWEAATQGFLPALAHAAQTANRLGDQVRIERYRKMQDEMQTMYTDHNVVTKLAPKRFHQRCNTHELALSLRTARLERSRRL